MKMKGQGSKISEQNIELFFEYQEVSTNKLGISFLARRNAIGNHPAFNDKEELAPFLRVSVRQSADTLEEYFFHSEFVINRCRKTFVNSVAPDLKKNIFMEKTRSDWENYQIACENCIKSMNSRF